MKIIISPAKRMRTQIDDWHELSQPIFLDQTAKLLKTLQQLPYDDLKKLLQCQDAIAQLNYERFQNMDLYQGGQAALLLYDGIQYQYMAPQVFTSDQNAYVAKHLRILSGFYGLLRPFDAIQPYRLEMQAKLKQETSRNLYDFWQDKLYRHLLDDDRTIINLASAEYSRAVAAYLQPEDCWIDVIFAEKEQDQIKEKGVYVKMARGEMVRYMASQKIEEVSDIKHFCALGFQYEASLSDAHRYVFIREGKQHVRRKKSSTRLSVK